MKRNILVYALMAGTVATLAAQEASQSNPYEGTSNPPPDSMITTPAPEPAPAPQVKPSPSHPAYAQSAEQPADSAQPQAVVEPAMQPSVAMPSHESFAPGMADGTDDGIVEVAPETLPHPALNERANLNDPDGDIVHPAALPPGVLGPGAVIRARLLDTLSTGLSHPGEQFRTRVASDVLQDGQVLIPAGAELDGIVVGVSTGHAGGHGSMHLRPESVVLPDGSRYRLYAQLSGAPGSGTRVGNEGSVTPGSRLKKDGIEYAGAVGGGAVTGAFLGGPGGALAGTIIGAGVITAHLLISHPQATLDSGTYLLFTLNQPLNLVPDKATGN